MDSTHALELARAIIQNDLDAAIPLLKLLYAFTELNDTLTEAAARDVLLFVYTKTDHCEDSMKEFISPEADHQTPRAA